MSAPPGDGDGWSWFLGGRVRVLVDAASTGGALSVVELDDPEGLAPPMHGHDREAELVHVTGPPPTLPRDAPTTG